MSVTGIINYGMGNLASVKNALDHLNIEARIISEPGDLHKVDKIVLPGVGAFGMAMQNLDRSGFSDAIRELVLVKQKPIIGLCLGMQLLLDSSTEHGVHKGLGIVGGKVLFFGDAVSGLTVPHIGWNDVQYPDDTILFRGLEPAPDYYFVHSYYCLLDDQDHVAGTTTYGIPFHSSIANGHIFGCQFHPEKSQRCGLTLLKNFNSV